MKGLFKKTSWLLVFVPAVLLFPSFCLGCPEVEGDIVIEGENIDSIKSSHSNVSDAVIDKMEAIIDQDTSRLQEIYKDIHENPELGFMEIRTSAIVATELKNLGYQVTSGIGKTGVIAILENGEGPTFMFRADMDANGVEEATGLPYESKVRVTNLEGIETPVAHLCGHDAHTTWLISLAKTMQELRDDWSGTLVLLAQPAEEPIEGAMAMIEDGLYTRYKVPKPDYFLALHTAPIPTGTLLTTVGRINTGSEGIDVTFHGIGGHGSAPHHSKDPVLMAGQAIVQLQSIVSRRVDPLETGILTIGSVQAGVDRNVIPTESHLKLKLHFSTPEVQDDLVNNIKLICDGIARSNGVNEDNMPTYHHIGYTPANINSADFIGSIRETLVKADFVDRVFKDVQVTGSDDAAVLIENIEGVKGAYLMVGTAEPKIFAEAQAKGHFLPFSPHEPNYQVDLNGIPFGSKLAAIIALDVLSK
jgi:amidohydrolase